MTPALPTNRPSSAQSPDHLRNAYLTPRGQVHPQESCGLCTRPANLARGLLGVHEPAHKRPRGSGGEARNGPRPWADRSGRPRLSRSLPHRLAFTCCFFTSLSCWQAWGHGRGRGGPHAGSQGPPRALGLLSLTPAPAVEFYVYLHDIEASGRVFLKPSLHYQLSVLWIVGLDNGRAPVQR